MTTEQLDDQEEDWPFWQVQSVFDETGCGGDFAYTIGLHRRGLPELHLWARPCLGDDPGHDWKLSSRDQCHVLNELAGALLRREIEVGSTFTREYDGGLATVTYRVDPAESPRDLEALGVPAGIDVLPVRWSLERPPEGLASELTAEQRARAAATYDEIVQGLDRAVTTPPGWQLPADPSFALDQRYGPLTPVVLARAGQLWQADDETLCDLLHVAVKVTTGFSLGWAASRATAMARPAGRRGKLERLSADVGVLVDRLTTWPPAQRRWRAVVRRSDPELWEGADGDQRSAIEESLGRSLHVLAWACLVVEAVADLADRELLLCGRGPWLSGLRLQRVTPGPEWLAAPAVQAAVCRLLGELSPADVRWLARTHRAIQESDCPSDQPYQQVTLHLEAWATVSAAGFALECHPALWRPLAGRSVADQAEAMASLQDWATIVASALTHRAQLSAANLEAFTAPYRSRIPDLERTLNTPL